MPAAPATSASSRLSVINCRTIRPRLAPSAVRTAISRVRVVALPRSSVAVLAQAINSTTPTTPHRRYSVRRTSPTSSSCRRTADTPRPLVAVRVLLLEARGNRGQLGLRLFERHVRLEPRHGEEIVSGAAGWFVVWGTQTSVSLGNWKPGGITPTMARGLPTRIVRSQDAGVAAKAALPVRMTDQRRGCSLPGTFPQE